MFVVIAVLGACDFESAPRPGQTRSQAQTQAQAQAKTTAVAPSPPPAGSGAVAVAQPDLVTPDCISVADHLVGLSLAAITTPSEQAIQTANRAKLVRATAESCTRGGWTPEVLRCFSGASTPEQLSACSALVAALPPPAK